MDEKPPPSRRSSGHSEKSKKSGKKKKKNKHKDRKRNKVSSPDETNSDSALEFGVRRKNKNASSTRQSPATSKSSTSVDAGARKSKSNTSSGSDIRSQNDYLERCISDIFERRRNASTIQLTSPSPSSSTSLGGGGARKNGGVSASSRNASSNGHSKISGDDDADVEEVCEAVNESLRWTSQCQDPKEEEERLRIYKINRRKRYLMDIVKTRKDKEGVLKFARELASLDAR